MLLNHGKAPFLVVLVAAAISAPFRELQGAPIPGPTMSAKKG